MKAVDVIHMGCGQSRFINTAIGVVRNLLYFGPDGIITEEARDVINLGYVANGVVEASSYIMGEGTIRVAKFVELALYNGWDPATKERLGP